MKLLCCYNEEMQSIVRLEALSLCNNIVMFIACHYSEDLRTVPSLRFCLPEDEWKQQLNADG